MTSLPSTKRRRALPQSWPPEKPPGIQISLRLQRDILLKLQRLADAAHQTKAQFISSWVEGLEDLEGEPREPVQRRRAPQITPLGGKNADGNP